MNSIGRKSREAFEKERVEWNPSRRCYYQYIVLLSQRIWKWRNTHLVCRDVDARELCSSIMVAGYTVHTENLQLLRKISKVAFKNQLVNGAFFLYNFMDR